MATCSPALTMPYPAPESKPTPSRLRDRALARKRFLHPDACLRRSQIRRHYDPVNRRTQVAPPRRVCARVRPPHAETLPVRGRRPIALRRGQDRSASPASPADTWLHVDARSARHCQSFISPSTFSRATRCPSWPRPSSHCHLPARQSSPGAVARPRHLRQGASASGKNEKNSAHSNRMPNVIQRLRRLFNSARFFLIRGSIKTDQRHIAIEHRVANGHRSLAARILIISMCGTSRKSASLLS